MLTQTKKMTVAAGLILVFATSVSLAQEKKAEKGEKAEKAKAEKVSGDIGLLDAEKNYMIVVTKDGKLVTLDYTEKTKITELKESKAKVSDIGLGSAASVQYTTKGEKNYLTSIEFTPAKGE